MINKKENIKNILLSYLMITFATAIYGIGVNSFLLAAKIPPGGFAGIGAVINSIFPVNIGIVMLILNLPLLIIWGIKNGFTLIIRTLYTTFLMSFFTDLFKGFFIATNNRLLAGIYGGILCGVALGMILLNGATSGGSDILAYGIRKKLQNVSTSKILLTIDIIVIISYATAVRDIESALYGGLEKFICTTVINMFLSGGERSKTFLVVTSKPKKIAKAIHYITGRGATLLKGNGMYKGDTVNILLVVAKRNEVFKLRNIISRIDNKVFMTLLDSSEVWGKGFLKQK